MDLEIARVYNRYDGIDDETILKLLTISKALGEIGKGGNYSVVSLLDGNDFKSLSEDDKARVFRHSGRNGTCVHKVECCDIPTYLQQMLPYMPLHKFQSCSLPTGLTWIESEEWMRDMLLKHKLRWNPDSNTSNIDDTKVQNDEDVMLQNDEDAMLQNNEDLMVKNSGVIVEDTLLKLHNLAFTMLAAELFYICCRVNAIHCCAYLLTIAPDLVDIKAGSSKSGALSTAKIHDCPDVINLLLEHYALNGSNIAQVTHFIFRNSENTSYFKFITNALACTDNKDAVTHFRDQHGNTLLHALFCVNSYWVWCLSDCDNMDEHFYLCFQMLLDCGIDPRVMNDCSETVLDKLLAFYASSNIMEDVNRIARKAIFLPCLKRILPFWGVECPSDFICQLETGHPNVIVFKIAELLLKDEHDFVFAIRSMHSVPCFLFKCLPSDCQLCRPTLTLFYLAMCKGIDMHSIPGEPIAVRYFVDQHTYKDYVGYLMGCSDRKNRLDGIGISVIQTSRGASSECCHWALLEFLVHSGHDVFSHIDARVTGALLSPVCVLKTFLTELSHSYFCMKSESHLDKIRSIMVMLNMYSPSMIPQLLAYLPGNGDYEKLMLETIAKMQDEFDRVRPLQLLCRLTIRGNVTWKDVEKLSLPGKLKQYLRIGEIHKNHVIHQIIDDETKAENKEEIEDTEEKQ